MTKWVYKFGGGDSEGKAEMKNLLGGKGANLAEMAGLGLPVPPGFTITTEVCTYYYDNGENYPGDLDGQVREAVAWMEKQLGKNFGSNDNPLLLSVRSGARASMPGMMDTVLNLGLNDDTVQGLIKTSGDERFAYDSFRRFITMYSNVVLGIDHHNFEEILEDRKEEKGYNLDTEMTAQDWKDMVEKYKAKVQEISGKPFPLDPKEQLWGAVSAVFDSWMNDRAIIYRKLNDIPASWGTAVNVQSMVFGNMGEDCATGVCFSRNPSNGDNHFYGEYLINAQGEDVVAGIRTPQCLTIYEKQEQGSELPSMEEVMPDVYKQLADIREKLEKHYTDMQDMEFTIESNKLFMLQTRNGKRTANAALKIAVDMCNEGLIDKKTAVQRVEPQSLDALLHPRLDPNAEKNVIATGLPASPGAASGKAVFTAHDAEVWDERGEKVMLVRIETSPEDIAGMHVAQGIITTRGGMTSHAAVVARGMGTPCVAGAGDLKVDYKAKTLSIGDIVIKEGDVVTIEGTSGEVMKGAVDTIPPELTGDFGTLMGWADEIRTLNVRTNAETPADCQQAREYGAEGIGLCRTEHMFFDAARIIHVRQMILSEDEAGRRAALDKLLPYQKQDFVDIFNIMDGLPVTIRLLDPPLHEFLPHTEADMQDVAKEMGVGVDKIQELSEALHEFNPMLGHRGCRLGVTYPEIYEMQARAICQAALECKKASKTVLPEIMIPLVGLKPELDRMADVVNGVADEVLKGEVEYLVGTMVELPRAAIQAGSLAETAQFFSFGTNDLTQTTFGLSRDDAGAFLTKYQDMGVIEKDPFVTLDREGVGELVKMGAERGRATRSDIKLGICGEHGGDPASVQFCHQVGLNYVSCSPFRVPIARLAAAQAALGVDTYSTA